MEELKPCPFCGGKAKVMDMGYPHWVYCTNCGAKVHGGTTDEIDSIEAWNRRTLEKQDVPDTNVGNTVSKRDAQERQCVAQKRRYTFANDEFSLEAAYRDCKLVFDGITDDDSFQEADAGLVFYYANEIIYALHEVLQSKDTNTGDTVFRDAVKLALLKKGQSSKRYKVGEIWELNFDEIREALATVPSAQPKPRTGKWLINSDGYYPYCSECKAEPKSGEMTDFCPKCGAKMKPSKHGTRG